MNLFQTIKKYPKDTLAVVGVILIGILAVSADGFSDLAKKKFWWNLWSIVHVLSIIACIVGWLRLRARDNAASKQ